MTKPICVIDLDSTHVAQKLSHQPTVITLLQTKMQAGLNVVVCTDHSLSTSRHYLTQLGLPDSAFVITNGGQTVETVGENLVFNHTLPQTYYQQIGEFAENFGLETILYDRHDQIQRLGDSLNADFETKAVVSAVITGASLTLNTSCAALNQALGDSSYLIRIADGAFAVKPVLNDKAEALHAIMAQLPDHGALTVLGDGFSVIPMFAQATQAVGLQHGSPLALRHATCALNVDDLQASVKTLNDLLSA
jgi:hydroxymethylpyrimidine pyrophosphatase-like HAD family hydrolase